MKRNFLLDNSKLIMIFFVVFGHMIEPLVNHSTLVDQSIIFEIIYKTIYTFHMPVFIFIAGLLTRQTSIENNEGKLIKSILIPFIAFTLLFELPQIIVLGTPSNYTKTLAPYWILWFLSSLFLWKISAPFFMKLRYPILLSIAISLVSGYFESIGSFLGLSRTLYFLPFFLIGYKLTPDYLSSSILFKIPKIIPITILLLVFIFFYFLSDISYVWLYGSLSYSKLGISDWYAPFIRLGFLTLSFISSAAIVLLIPNKSTFYTNRGSKSLYIYICGMDFLSKHLL